MQDVGVGVWLKLIAVAFVEFVLEFYPVETDCVKEALQLVHKHKDAECDGPENGPENDALHSNEKVKFGIIEVYLPKFQPHLHSFQRLHYQR